MDLPRPPSSHAIPGPETINCTVLDNGMTLLVRENHSAPVIVLEGFLPVGAVHDPAGQTGLAALVADMVTHGNETHDFEAFNEVIESVGASLSASADLHATGFGLSCLSEDFSELIGLLAGTLRRPTFPAAQLAIVQGQLAVDFQERDHDTQRLSHLRFYETLYGDHPYGRAVNGYPETVAGIGRDDLAAFHSERYTPQGAVVVLSGNIKTAAAVDQINHVFGDWRGPNPAPQIGPPRLLNDGRRIEIDLPDKHQSDIVIGVRAVPRDHPDFYALRVANTVLGRFGMMGRLGERVREEMGLAYHCYSTQDAELVAGAWLASAGVDPADVEEATAAILNQFQRLGNEPVAVAELRDSQDFMTGILPLGLETNGGVASTLLAMAWYGLGLDYLQRYNDLIYGVTVEDVQRVAQHYLQADRCVTVVAGPANV